MACEEEGLETKVMIGGHLSGSGGMFPVNRCARVLMDSEVWFDQFVSKYNCIGPSQVTRKQPNSWRSASEQRSLQSAGKRIQNL